MNKKLMTMLVACALSVSALSTTTVFAEDAVVTGETPAVTETTTTPVAYEPEITLTTPKWTGDSDIVFEVDAKGGAVYPQEMYVYGADDAAMPIISVPSKVEVNEEGKGKVTFTNDALKNAKTWDDTFTNQISVDWTNYSKIEFAFAFELNGQDKYKSMYVETSVKAPAPTVTPTTPTKPAKPAENKGTTTTTTTTTTTKKEVPKTGDTMNAALYASLLVVSALAAVVLATKKKVTE
ncbi:MAG: LPXTG cell wall anchor domain-containing protein [Catenibacterium mitsuokai]